MARARRAALAAGVAERVSFEVAAAADVPGGPYDLVTFIDSVHDLGDPVGALRQARKVLADDGVVLLVEHAGSDRLEENLSPAGRFFYAASALVCVPNALAEQSSGASARGDPGRAGAAAGGGSGRILPGAAARRGRAVEPPARTAPLTRVGADNVRVSGPASLVGRDPAVTVLRAALDGALAGHGGLVLITGEPGIGKTALAAHLADQAAARGVPVAWGRCAEGDAAPAFWPWTQVLRATGGLAGGEDHVGPQGAAADGAADTVPGVRPGRQPPRYRGGGQRPGRGARRSPLGRSGLGGVAGVRCPAAGRAARDAVGQLPRHGSRRPAPAAPRPPLR